MPTITITSDGDPYPAQAGNPLVNDGVTEREGFLNGNNIITQAHNYIFENRAGLNTEQAHATGTDAIGVAMNGVTLYSPSAGNSVLPGIADQAPTNFNWNIVHKELNYKLDRSGGYVPSTGEYNYRSGSFVVTGWRNPKFTNSNAYYKDTSHLGDNLRHTDGHSKIIGWIFDGYPLYGPYGYHVADSNTSGTAQMTSSYRLKEQPTEGRLFGYRQHTNGSFIEDYQYSPNLGTLDQYNGRYCVTPDYPEGTYAYFTTFALNDLYSPAYPYIVGPSTKQQRST